jgi:dolichol-phosphate mannosyltransferase
MKRIANEDVGQVRRFLSFCFYKGLNLISDTEVLAKSTDFRLLDKKVVRDVKRLSERQRVFRTLVDWVGYSVKTLEFEAPKRAIGESRFNWMGLVRLAVNTVTSHSLFPLRFAGYLGTAMVTISGGLLLFMTADRLLFSIYGFTNLSFVIVGNTMLIGIVLICLGLIALYIGNIHIEVQNRPIFLIRESNVNNESVEAVSL